MSTMQYDEQFVEMLAAKIADRATEIMTDRINSRNTDLPHILTREETMDVLRCGKSTLAELMRRPDFPVTKEFGTKIPTHLLFKWIEKNTRWVDENTDYFKAI
ncbi:hypothetical protein [Bacillus badius]|uniref:DNA-binding protein n=1 Tax=Bacillus badius TaxID=1455 RepID=A0ABR5AP99_BACBA|nr:hypothetical protein [Bacillus badius]KIL74176.1 hypothetical protein SD77_2917 [Bacillus badius]MED4718169.1 hypothetical protein [Bacillus badius]